MTITAGFALILLASLIALYKHLSPRDRTAEMVHATSKFHLGDDPVDQATAGALSRNCVLIKTFSCNCIMIAIGISVLDDVVGAEDSKQFEDTRVAK